MRAGIALIIMLALGGCDRGNPSICGTPGPRPTMPVKNWAEQRAIMISCVDHWAARLSLAPDRADIVADAVIGACRDAIEMEVDLWNRENPERTSTVDRQIAASRNDALFRVVQWRAGNCPLPKVA